MAKSAAGGGMLDKLLAPIYAKVPEMFRPLVKAVLGKLIAGDKDGAKKEMIEGVKKIAVKKAVHYMEPLLKKLPKQFRPMVKSTLEVLLQGDVKAAITVLKGGIVKYGVSKIERLLTPMTAKLPPFLAAPVKTFLLDNVKKLAAAHVAEERRRELGLSMDDDAGLDVTAMVMGEGVKLVNSAVPKLIEQMTSKLPSSLEPAKEPLNEALTGMVTKIVGVLGGGPSNWNADGMGKITKNVIETVKTLADKLKSLGLQAMGAGEERTFSFTQSDRHTQQMADDWEAAAAAERRHCHLPRRCAPSEREAHALKQRGTE